MTRIEKSDWIKQLYARVTEFADVLREPVKELAFLSKLELDDLRNTQVHMDDVVRVLGHHQDFSLIMKQDGSKGWLRASQLEHLPEVKDFVRPVSPRMKPEEFLKEYKEVPYLWGGLSKAGIDCSGLTQLYFFSVHDKLIPKNSREQRRLSEEKPLSEAKDHDLVFGVSRRTGSHHVGLFLNSSIWHAYTDEGVACHSVERFSELFTIEAVVTVP